jgi:cobalt-zinc-cadmium efflux system protein
MTHTHVTPAAASRNRLGIVFGITLAVFLFELVGGIAANSLALIADAGHLLTDLAGIGLTLVAIWFAARPANRNRSYGLMRLEILAAVVNAMLLFAVAAYVLVEAWRRWNSPPEIEAGLMLVVAVVGLVANGVSLAVLRDAQRESLPMRGAYLEVMGDLVGSVAVIVAALVIAATGQVRADAIASVLIGVLILPRTWTLLKDAVDVLLEASPKGIDLGDVRAHILEAPGVADVHDLHAWTITSGMNVVSAHVVLDADASPPTVLDYLCGCLSGDFDIEHSTFQLETSDRSRLEAAHHA